MSPAADTHEDTTMPTTGTTEGPPRLERKAVAAVVLLQQAIDVEKSTGTPAGVSLTESQEST